MLLSLFRMTLILSPGSLPCIPLGMIAYPSDLTIDVITPAPLDNGAAKILFRTLAVTTRTKSSSPAGEVIFLVSSASIISGSCSFFPIHS